MTLCVLCCPVCDEQHVRLVKLCAFTNIWATCIPYIKLPSLEMYMYDCVRCEGTLAQLSEEKRRALAALTTHTKGIKFYLNMFVFSNL